jgi:hypothetical protein
MRFLTLVATKSYIPEAEAHIPSEYRYCDFILHVSECRNSEEKPERCSVASRGRWNTLLWPFNYIKEAGAH